KSQIATEGFSFFEKLKFWNRKRHKFDIISVKKDVIRIRDFYHQQGFLATEVHYHIKNGGKKWKKIVIFTIDEKATILISDISLHFLNNKRYKNSVKKNKEIAKVRRNSDFQVGKRYVSTQKGTVSSHYQEILKNIGFAYADVKIDARVDTTK